jgi:putative oxidoreductase
MRAARDAYHERIFKMKMASTISQYLLGVIFVVIGLNGFLNFIPAPPPSGVVAQFVGALYVSHYLLAIMAVQLIGGLLLFINRFTSLGLTLLGPVIVNILFFHVFMDPGGLSRAAVVIVLWFLAAYNARSAFAGIIQSTADSVPTRRNQASESATVR